MVVTSGNDLENVNLKLSRTATVRVRCRVLNAKPLSAYLMPSAPIDVQGGFQAEALADDGFEFNRVPPGDYLIRVVVPSSPDHHYFVHRPITVGVADIEGLTIAIPPPAWIDGRVVIEGGTQIDWSHVNLSIGPPPPDDFQLGAPNAKLTRDGTFHFGDLAPDRYRVSGSASGLYLKSVRMSGRELPGQILELGASADIEVVFSPKVASVAGVVHMDGTDAQAAAADVVLIPQENDRRKDRAAYQFTTTDDSGRFHISSIPPGEYLAFAWEKRYRSAVDYMDPDFVHQMDGKGVAVALSEESSVTLELTATSVGK